MVSLTNEGNTILHAAVLSHKAPVVKYALTAMANAMKQGASLLGSDLNARNAKGESALELATQSGMYAIARVCIKWGKTERAPH